VLLERLALLLGDGESVKIGQQPPALAEAAAPAGGCTARVLLAEDNHINALLATTILKTAGYDVDWVANGELAVDALARQHYDLVLMDVQMPVMDGLQATGLIRQQGAAMAQPPIVAMTANVMGPDRDRCRAVGMDDFIGKPIDAEEFLTVIGRHIGGRHGDDANFGDIQAQASLTS
jgi:CheY-like chemotaxis protein